MLIFLGGVTLLLFLHKQYGLFVVRVYTPKANRYADVIQSSLNPTDRA